MSKYRYEFIYDTEKIFHTCLALLSIIRNHILFTLSIHLNALNANLRKSFILCITY